MSDNRQQERKSRGARRRARYREIATVLWEERLFDLFKGTGLEDDLPGGTAAELTPGTKEKDLSLPVRVRHALERLGPVFVKLGQLLATRSALLPPALLEELAKLQDDVPKVPWPEMRTRVEAELGASVEELFESFDEEPLAAASIGQVYRATLPDGTPVAVKVQRPGVTKAMEINLDIMHDLADRLTKHVQWAKENDVATIAEEFASVPRAELDYTHEGRSLDRFRSAFAADPSLVFPQIYWDQTTSRVLTMDLIEGVRATELESNEKAAGVDRAHLVQIGTGAYFRMIFQLGFYHADPHAGNLFALPGGRLGFVDFGRVATISERNREATFDMLLAMVDDDPTGVTEAVLAMLGMPPHIDLAALEIDISAMLARYRRQQSSGEGLDKLVQSLLKLMRDHQLQVPPELTVLLTTIGVLEGVATQIDPAFRMIDVVKPFARKLMPERYGPGHILKASLRSARAYGRFFDQLPVHATRALRRVGEGEFKVAVRPENYEALVDRLTAGVYLLAYALIVGALIVGFAFLIGRQDLTQLERIGYRVVLFAAIASVIWFVIRSLRIEWHKRQADRRAAEKSHG
ncbi:MAG: AarF/UbiB family protein [Thermodesulfobacteriota bacterium]|jgi:ubiquinone biosynthesis protein